MRPAASQSVMKPDKRRSRVAIQHCHHGHWAGQDCIFEYDQRHNSVAKVLAPVGYLLAPRSVNVIPEP